MTYYICMTYMYMYTYTYTYIHTFIYIYTYSINIHTCSHGHVLKYTRSYILMLMTITIKNTFLEKNKMILNFNRGGVKVLKFSIVCPLKTLIFGRWKHLENSSKILANTFPDSLAILKKKIAGWRRRILSHRKIPGSLPVLITLSELWEWLFLFPSHDSFRERTPLSPWRNSFVQIHGGTSLLKIKIWLPLQNNQRIT